MELVKVCAFALMGVLLALQFKGGKQEYGIYLGAALAVVVFSCTLSYMGQAKKQLMGLWQQLSGGQSYLTLLFKVVGITWISELVSGICKDSGYSAVASQVELFGKSLFCLPECRFSLHWRKQLQDLQEGKGWNLGIQSIIWNS